MKLAVNTVTLRSHSPEDVLRLLSSAGFDAVEWAGDTHVPPDDLETAKAIRALTENAGFEITSYGSYYQCDTLAPASAGPFSFNRGAQAALETADILGTSDVRVWAGRYASEVASTSYREEVAVCLQEFCDQALSLGMRVHLEFHRNTLTDTAESSLRLLDAVSRDNLYSYWQPRHGASVEENLADIDALGSRLSNVHVFHWRRIPGEEFAVERLPLVEGRERWIQYFKAIDKIPGNRYAMLEFVRNDKTDQLFQDAKALRDIKGEATKA